MSDNPYAQPQDYAGAPEYLEPKTSLLAIFAFVVAILGLVACCIPGVGPLGLLLGVLALVTISMSGGRKKGGGFAIAAVVIGLIAGAINVFVVIGAVMAGKQWSETGMVVEAIEARDLQAVESRLGSTAAAQLDQAMLDAFADSVNAHYGAMQQRPQGLLEALQVVLKASTQTANAQNATQREYSSPGDRIMPIAIEFDSAPVVFIIVGNPQTGDLSRNLTNVGYLAPDGTMVWLVPPPSGHGALLPPAAPSAPVADPADGGDGG